uniref:ABC transporter substrate-binding protein n=1 Tax=Candidatus Methanosuratincola petrocarbonis (ex Vanwonterghem et al. 2016) TaxID=1867261 RepID=A0A7J3UZ52_9CREN
MPKIKTIGALAVIALAISLVTAALVFSNNSTLSALDSRLIAMNSTLNNLKGELSSLQDELNIVRASYYPLVIEDALGRVVTIKSEPTRIVSGAPSITETLFALGLSSRVVGADSYSNYPSEFLQLKAQGKIAIVGGVTTLDPEKVAAQKPDLVVIDASLQGKFIPALESLGLTVVALDTKSVESAKSNFQLLAKITYKLSEGVRIVDRLNTAIQNVSGKVSGSSPTKVLFVVWHDPMYAAGNGTYLGELISIAGGVNIAGNRTGWVVVNPEQVVAANPDVLIMSSMSLPMNPEQIFAYFRSLPGFENVNAVRNNRVYILTEDASNALERAGPRLVDGVYILGYILHPEAFKVQLPNVLAGNYTSYLGR